VCFDIVFEKLAKGRPESGGVGGVAEDMVQYIRGHPLVDPQDDCEVVLDPTRIRESGTGGDDDVIQEVAVAEMDLEEMAPKVVVVLWKI
jgi:hypothetical protein